MLEAAKSEKLHAFRAALLRLNRRHNLVARGEAAHFWERHIRHSLALTARPFPRGATIVDWGTGGGLPAVPLAIAAPDVTVVAVDSAQKKIWAVRSLARELGLANLRTWCGRAQRYPGAATHSVSRAVAPLKTLWRWHARIASAGAQHEPGAWAPGLLCLKGGNLGPEMAVLQNAGTPVGMEVVPLDGMGPWFRQKAIVHVYSRSAMP